MEDLNLRWLGKTKQANYGSMHPSEELFRRIEYKCLGKSKHFVQVDRFLASSKLCSACGYKNNDLSLSDRQWKCPSCGTEQDRDFNAAINIKGEGLRILAARCAENRNVHGERVRLAEASRVGRSGNDAKPKGGQAPARIPCL